MDPPQSTSHGLPDARQQRQLDARRFRRAALISMVLVASLWWIKMIETWTGVSFAVLAIYPGDMKGLLGLLTAPLLHGSMGHLINNSLPLLVLGTLVFSIYPRSAWRATALIWIGSGLGVWLFGRESFHLGASGLTHGWMYFLFILGVVRRDRPAIAGMLIAMFLYGSMLLTILPGDPQISWEAHMGGAAMGVLAALLWRRRDPPPPRKRYSWEDEEEMIEPLEDALAAAERSAYEPPSPEDVPVLWRRVPPVTGSQTRGQVILFPRSRRDPDQPDEPD